MKPSLLLAVFASAALISACGGAATNTTNSSANNAAVAKAPEKKEEKPAVTLKPGEVPFDGMSNVPTTAKAGDIVLAVDDEKKAAEIAADPASASAIFQNRIMVTPGEFESELEDSFKKKYKVPNAYIIPVPKGQKAKVGDVVLTWWQSGGGMMRGYVTDAANPAEPTVRYLGMSPREDKSDKLKPDSFIVVSSDWTPGAVVAAKDGNGQEFAMVLRVNGDKVFVQRFARKLKVMPKSDLTPVAYKQTFKVGDEVKAAFFSSFDPATVVAIDQKAGKVTVKRKTGDEQKDLDFGEVIK